MNSNGVQIIYRASEGSEDEDEALASSTLLLYHKSMRRKAKNFIFDLLFPKFCLSCQKEGNYLCEDCQSILLVSGVHQKNPTQNLKDLYFAIDYQQPLIKNLIKLFKYQPFVKELVIPLTSLIITHFQLIEKSTADFVNFILVPVPLERKKLKWRGFNQAEELGKELSSFLKIPLISGCLIKIKETPPQVELSDEERKENIKGVFTVVKEDKSSSSPATLSRGTRKSGSSFAFAAARVKNGELIKNKKILLIDDVYTTGSTMEECARVLKEAGAKEIIGIVVARG